MATVSRKYPASDQLLGSSSEMDAGRQEVYGAVLLGTPVPQGGKLDCAAVTAGASAHPQSLELDSPLDVSRKEARGTHHISRHWTGAVPPQEEQRIGQMHFVGKACPARESSF